jgi:hypothetical protein
MAVRRRAMEYRSEQVWGTLPVIHVAVGAGRPMAAIGPDGPAGSSPWGDAATGLVAVGGVAIGLFSVGGVAVGLVALGGVAIGLVAVGAVAIGLFAAGAVAIGLTAMGAVTAGVVAGPRLPGGWRRRGTCGWRVAARRRRMARSAEGARSVAGW